MRKLLLLILLASLLTACHYEAITGVVTHKAASATPHSTVRYSVEVTAEDEYSISLSVTEYVYSLVEVGKEYEFKCSHSCQFYGFVRPVGDADDGE